MRQAVLAALTTPGRPPRRTATLILEDPFPRSRGADAPTATATVGIELGGLLLPANLWLRA